MPLQMEPWLQVKSYSEGEMRQRIDLMEAQLERMMKRGNSLCIMTRIILILIGQVMMILRLEEAIQFLIRGLHEELLLESDELPQKPLIGNNEGLREEREASGDRDEI